MNIILLATAIAQAAAPAPSPVEQARAIVGDAPTTTQTLVLSDVPKPTGTPQRAKDRSRLHDVARRKGYLKLFDDGRFYECDLG